MPSGEKLATVKKQLKVHKKKAEPTASTPGPSKAKNKRKGVRLRKGVSIKVPFASTSCLLAAQLPNIDACWVVVPDLHAMMLQGIKIVDAASKRKVKQLLGAEAEMRTMEVESNAGWEEAAPSDLEDME